LLVSPQFRGKGIGKALIKRIETEAKRKGAVRLMLNNAKYSTAYKSYFYKKNGFKERNDFSNFVKLI